MQLCDREIFEAIKSGKLMFITPESPSHPFNLEEQVQPASVDLRLGPRILRFNPSVKEFDIRRELYDANESLYIEEHVDENNSFCIKSGETVFGSIYELIKIPDTISARVRGRSRVSRLGISVHCTGDYINPGFKGEMPLQITNHGPFSVRLYPYFPICQMVFYRLTHEPLIPYGERKKVKGYESIAVENNAEQSIVKEEIRRMIDAYYESLSNSAKERIDQNERAKIVDENYSAIVNIQNLQKWDMQMGNNGNTYITGQAGVVGDRAAENASVVVNQCGNKNQAGELDNRIDKEQVDYAKLDEELKTIIDYLKEHLDEGENAIALEDVTQASQSIKNGDTKKADSFLKKSGKILLDVAKKVCSGLIQEYLKIVLGLK